MPATPAWPPHGSPRIFIERPLAPVFANAGLLDIYGQQAHYLTRVMRLKAGDQLRLFDNISGEYLAVIEQAGKKAVDVRIEQHLRPREEVPDFWLCATPLKKARFDFLVEKACEIGVARLVPVRTQRTNNDRIRPERIRAQMIEAAEQCERTSLPELAEIVTLEELLASWPDDRHLFFADERLHQRKEGDDDDSGSYRKALRMNPGAAAVLIGPEGGFTHEEQEMIRACPKAIAISLGPRILRAETAAIAASALWMAGRGDWD